MRTELTLSRAATAAHSLTDFTRAVNDANASRRATATTKLTVATDMATAIPPALLTAAAETLDGALAGQHPADPMLGPSLSRLISAVNATVKRSGPLIERSLVAPLEQAGLVVMRHVAMPVTDAAKNLVAYNQMRALRGVSVTEDAPASGPMIVYDLLVYCPKTRRATLIEVKRGNGATELRKIKPITAALKAGSLQVRSHLKKLGIKARHVDAKLVDYYGHSGFDDDIRITGSQLDRYFGAPVQGVIEAVLGEVRNRLFGVMPQLLATAMAEAAHGPAQEPRTITIGDGIRIAPEHVSAVELPTRRNVKLKPARNVIAIRGRQQRGSAQPVSVQ